MFLLRFNKPAPAKPNATCLRLRAIWLVGSFSMTGAEFPRHAAQISAMAGSIGLRSLFVGYGPRIFCQEYLGPDLSRTGADAGLVIYLRSVTRPPGLAQASGLRRLRTHLWRLSHLWRLLRQPGPVVLVRSPFRFGAAGFAEWALEGTLRLRFGRRICAVGAKPDPSRVIAALTGKWPTPVKGSLAEEQAFQQILSTRPEGLRLSEGHINRATDALEKTCDEAETEYFSLIYRDLRRCMYIANAIGRTRMERMLANIRLEDIDASRAIRACIAPDPDDPSATRIGQHLRMIGQAKLARQAFTRSTEPQTGNSDVLRVQKRLAGVDTEGASGLDRHLAGDDSNLTELEAVVLFALRARMQSTEAFRAPWRRSAWREVVERLLPEGHPARQADRGERHTNRISVHGFASDGTGLGKNMWMSMQALKSCGLPAELCPVDGSSTTSLPTLATANHEVLTRNVALHHVNADRIPLTIFEAYRHRPAYQIGFLLWELDRIPRAHRLALDMLDEIWVPSAFLQKIYQPAFSGRVILMRKGIDVPDVAKEALPAGLEKKAGVTRFVVAFDANSSVSRKNPLAAVRAFCRAFGPERHDVELIIKSTPVAQEHWGDPEGQMGEIAAIAAEDPRIRPVCRYCTFPQLLKLIESADALISPHRAEGFGYLPAYALLLGRPTIVTDYSGTRDFCTESTCIPVPYRLRRVPRQHSILPTSGARWAEIDGDALVESLRWVKRNPEAALARAGHGRNLMQIEYGMEAQATRYRLRLEQLGLVAGTQHFENGREQQGA